MPCTGGVNEEPRSPRRYYRWRKPRPVPMKKSVPALVALLALGSGFASFTAGCTGTATRESTGEYVDDAGITARVKAAFVRDPAVKAIDVKVETFKGTVQLSGFVDSQEQKIRAEQIARTIQGVQTVTNNISVK